MLREGRSLLQVGIFRKDGTPVDDPSEIGDALALSGYDLDSTAPVVLIECDEDEADLLMARKSEKLPSGYRMEIPAP